MNNSGRAILGIDAAWTEREPTGVALIEEGISGWNTVAVALSYATFVELSKGSPIDWDSASFPGNWPRIPELMRATRELTSAQIAVAAVDMPIATVPITSRRAADSAISREFGGMGCSAHSPSAERPGELGAAVMSQLRAILYASRWWLVLKVRVLELHTGGKTYQFGFNPWAHPERHLNLELERQSVRIGHSPFSVLVRVVVVGYVVWQAWRWFQ